MLTHFTTGTGPWWVMLSALLSPILSPSVSEYLICKNIHELKKTPTHSSRESMAYVLYFILYLLSMYLRRRNTTKVSYTRRRTHKQDNYTERIQGLGTSRALPRWHRSHTSVCFVLALVTLQKWRHRGSFCTKLRNLFLNV